MSNRVERCDLAPDLNISRVVTGMWQIADMERSGDTLNPRETAATMSAYIAAGLNTFDMADHYGSAEVIAGHLRRQHDSDIQLFTKWVPKPGPATRADVRTAVQRALDRMQTDRLDMMQFHAWNYADPGWLDCLYWLEELRDEGCIAHLGLTNFDSAHLDMVLQSGIDVVSNQICFSLLDQRARGGMTEVCERHGIKLLAFGTLAGGFLSERWLGKTAPDADRLDTWSQMKYLRFINSAGGWDKLQYLLRTLERVAQKTDVSIANVACRYMLEEPAVGGIIIGARPGKSEHIADNLRLFQFSLDEENRTEIAEAVDGLENIPGDCGDEYRRPPFLTASGDLKHHIDTLPAPYQALAGGDGRNMILTGTVWEKLAGFSRAVQQGNHIYISGTTATAGDRVIGGSSPAAQMNFVIDKIDGALQSLGSDLHDVVRTRVYVRHVADWEAVARVHGDRFRDIQPANTLVQATLVGDAYLVEMEAEAVLSGSQKKGE